MNYDDISNICTSDIYNVVPKKDLYDNTFKIYTARKLKQTVHINNIIYDSNNYLILDMQQHQIVNICTTSNFHTQYQCIIDTNYTNITPVPTNTYEIIKIS